eukprot:5132708-Pleurochrysis_carterae.AAC.3
MGRKSERLLSRASSDDKEDGQVCMLALHKCLGARSHAANVYSILIVADVSNWLDSMHVC